MSLDIFLISDRYSSFEAELPPCLFISWNEMEHGVRINFLVCTVAFVYLLIFLSTQAYVGKRLKLFMFQYIMDKLEPPQVFSFDGHVSHSWKLLLKYFDFCLAVTEKDTKNDKIKIFLTCIAQ